MGSGKNKRRRYMKINLMETSVVGIPAYPDAHLSFIKALSHHIQKAERRQTNTNTTMSETVKETTAVETLSEKVEMQKEEKNVEISKEPENTEVEKSMEEKFLEALEKAIETAVNKMTVERGLVESDTKKQEEAKAELKNLSVGELAIKSGWFTKI